MKSLLGAFVLLLLPAPVLAQFSIEVSPLRVELKMAPGGNHTQVVTLKNDGNDAIRVHARLDDWFLSMDGTPQFKPADPNDRASAAPMVRFTPAEQVVAPRGEALLRFTTTVPAGTPDGGYHAAIMFDFDPPGTDPTGRARDVRLRSRIATLVYVTVGNPAVSVDLTDLEIRQAPNQPPRVIATLKNTGKGHVRTKGTVSIYDAANKVVRQLPVPDVPVLPHSEREVSIWTVGEQQDPLGPGQYRVEVKIDVGLPALLVGETTMTVK